MNQAFPANYWAYLNTPSDDAYSEVVDASAMTVEGAVAYGEPYYDYLYGEGFDPRLAGNLGGPWGGKSVTPKGYMYSADIPGGEPAATSILSSLGSSAMTSATSLSGMAPGHPQASRGKPAAASFLSSLGSSAMTSATSLSGMGPGHPQASHAASTSLSSGLLDSATRWRTNDVYEPPSTNSPQPYSGVLWDAPETPVLTHVSVSSGTSPQELVQEYPVFDVQTMSATHTPATSLHEFVEEPPIPLHVMSVSQMVRGDAQMAAAMAAAASPTKGRKTYSEVAKLPPKPRPAQKAPDYLMNERKQDKAVRGVMTGDKQNIAYKDKQRKLQAKTAAAEKRVFEQEAKKAAKAAEKAVEAAFKARSSLEPHVGTRVAELEQQERQAQEELNLQRASVNRRLDPPEDLRRAMFAELEQQSERTGAAFKQRAAAQREERERQERMRQRKAKGKLVPGSSWTTPYGRALREADGTLTLHATDGPAVRNWQEGTNPYEYTPE